MIAVPVMVTTMRKAMNLVFDLGGVVFTWNPEQIIQQMFHDHKTRHRVKEEIFHHNDWIALDRGTLDRETAIQRAASRTGLSRKDVAMLINNIPHFLVPVPETIDLIRRIKRTTAHHLFVLSNMHTASIRHLEQTYPVWDLFDGIVISSHIRMVKPELDIYRYLIKQYGLSPTDTVFIDDTQVNLDAALQVGIQTIRFENPEQCERALEAMGYI
jgi:putative hydrolase of the HAD superfamily